LAFFLITGSANVKPQIICYIELPKIVEKVQNLFSNFGQMFEILQQKSKPSDGCLYFWM